MNSSLWPIVAILFNAIIIVLLGWVGFAFNTFTKRQTSDKEAIQGLIANAKENNATETNRLRERITICEKDIKDLKQKEGTIEGTIRVLTVKIETLCKSVEAIAASINKIAEKT